MLIDDLIDAANSPCVMHANGSFGDSQTSPSACFYVSKSSYQVDLLSGANVSKSSYQVDLLGDYCAKHSLQSPRVKCTFP
jgi:hypothetical protein